MTTPGAETLPDDVNEADWAEQVLDADPVTEEAGQPGSRPAVFSARTTEVNEADLADQATLAYGEADELRD